VQVWLRSVWQPSLPRTENSDARAGRSCAIFLLTPSHPTPPPMAGVGQVSARTT